MHLVGFSMWITHCTNWLCNNFLWYNIWLSFPGISTCPSACTQFCAAVSTPVYYIPKSPWLVLFLSHINPVHSFPLSFFNTVSPSLLVPCEMSLPFRFWDESLYAFLISSMRASCSVLSRYLITLFGKEYTLQSASICIFLFLPLISFSWSQNILLLSSYTPFIFLYCESWGVIHITRWLCGVSHPYKNWPCNCSFVCFNLDVFRWQIERRQIPKSKVTGIPEFILLPIYVWI